MSTEMIKIVNALIIVSNDNSDCISASDLKDAYIQCKGSSTGINGFRAYLVNDLSIVKKTINKSINYIGIKFKKDEPVIKQVVEKVTIVDNNKLNIEYEMLKLKQEKLKYIQQKEQRDNERKQRDREEAIVKEQRDREEALAKEQRDNNEKQLDRDSFERMNQDKIKGDMFIAKMKIDACREECMKNRYLTHQMMRNNKVDMNLIGNVVDQYITKTSMVEIVEARVEEEFPQLCNNEMHDVQKSLINQFKDHDEVVLVKSNNDEYEKVLSINLDNIYNECKQIKNSNSYQSIVIESNLVVSDEFINSIKSIISYLETAIQNKKKSVNSNHHPIFSNEALDRWTRENNRTDKIAKMLSRDNYIKSENKSHIGSDGKHYIHCFCCDTKLNINSSERSHIVAESHGGTFNVDNICLCCRTCNSEMKTMDLHTYKAKMKAVGAF